MRRVASAIDLRILSAPYLQPHELTLESGGRSHRGWLSVTAGFPDIVRPPAVSSHNLDMKAQWQVWTNVKEPEVWSTYHNIKGAA